MIRGGESFGYRIPFREIGQNFIPEAGRHLDRCIVLAGEGLSEEARALPTNAMTFFTRQPAPRQEDVNC
jgi:hypothetical protein